MKSGHIKQDFVKIQYIFRNQIAPIYALNVIKSLGPNNQHFFIAHPINPFSGPANFSSIQLLQIMHYRALLLPTPIK
ncbi:hypothetical protein WS50_12770 [Burkholderia territorii]|nr:hypothetical protein WS47_30605 [Burkholderia territorii]KUZ17648.1 hypothetical protein WS50_12770 [Burkholderia territorii]